MGRVVGHIGKMTAVANSSTGKGMVMRRASSPSLHIMMDMADETDAVERQAKVLEKLDVDDFSPFSRQSTEDADTPSSCQSSETVDMPWSWSRQSTEASGTPTICPPLQATLVSCRRGRRSSSPSLHMMQDMAGEMHGDESEDHEASDTEVGNLEIVTTKDAPRRRASSPSIQMMLDMADEAAGTPANNLSTHEPKALVSCSQGCRSSSSSLPVTHDMADEMREYETEDHKASDIAARNLTMVTTRNASRRRASSPSVQMMLDMADEA